MNEGIWNRKVQALIGKELRQVSRSRSALLSAALLPVIFILVEPYIQLRALLASPLSGVSGQVVVVHFGEPRALFTGLSLPLFVTLAGILAAPVLATHTVVAERERRTLDLLMALPVSVGEILSAKVLGVLIVGAGIVLPFFLLEIALLLASGIVGVGYAVLLALVLVGALVNSIGVTTIITLLARDYRTARQLSGIPTVVVLLVTIAILFFLSGPAALLTLAVVLGVLGALGVVAARRWLTFERYLP